MDEVIEREVHDIFKEIQWSNYDAHNGYVDLNEYYEVMNYSRKHLELAEDKKGPFSKDKLNAKFW
jgi:hypothetical protein